MNIVLITGGLSAEREVSLASGKSILTALRENGHNVTVVDPIYGSEIVGEDYIFKNNISQKYPEAESLNSLKEKSAKKVLECIASDIFDKVDIAFIALHGKFGEDGRIQALLETRGINYTGSGVLTSALAMDKNYTKVLFEHYGILTPKWHIIRKSNNLQLKDLFSAINSNVGFPCVVKPNDEGSTVGLTILENGIIEDFIKAVELGFNYSDTLLIEEYIKGRELTAPVIDDKAYPLIEVKPKNGFYDYKHKYTSGMTEYICPAEVSETEKNNMQAIAEKVHKALGCQIYSRVDFILTDNGKAYCLEGNTLPGMTSLSLVPKSAAIVGLDFNKLIDKIINLSLKKVKS